MANQRQREEMYDTARGLHGLGLVDAKTLRELDASRLPAVILLNIVECRRLTALTWENPSLAPLIL